MLQKILHIFRENIQKVLFLSQKLSIKVKIDFLEQLGSLLSSGIPITNSLKIIKFQTKNKSLKRIIDSIIDTTNKGIGFGESLSKFPHTFNQFDLSIVEMGEVTGRLDQAIETIRKKEEKTKELTTKIIGALIYPTIIIALSVGMIGVFMIYVIPKIQDMYKDAKVNLPALTQKVIYFSNFLQEYYMQIVILFIVVLLIARFLKSYSRTRIYFDRYVLKIPLVGTLIKKKILTHFTQALSTLLSSGVIINKALGISAGVVNNEYYKQAIYKLNVGISEGQELSKLLGVDNIALGKEDELFPIDLAGAVKIGEQTGKLAEAFGRISVKFEREIDNIVKNLQTLVEPLVIVIVGLVVGTLILAIMLPFFNMVNVL